MAATEERDDSKSDEFCLICATVAIGLEKVCALECERKLACKVRLGRGRIYFEIPRKVLPKVKDLRSVENLFVVVSEIACFNFSSDESVEDTLERFYRLPDELNWEPALHIWEDFNKFSYGNAPTVLPLLKLKCVKVDTMQASENGEDLKERHSEAPVPTENTDESTAASVLPRFRVTCTRTHSEPSLKHPFTSMQAAAKFGGGINDLFGWIVDLENFDLEVLLNIVDAQVVVGISLTKESLFRRNIVNFGPTTLRSTLAYCLALAADIKEGDLVCDPLCGSGAISIETAVEWPCSFNMSGDNFPSAPPRTQDNVTYVNNQRSKENKKSIMVDTFLWDACRLPLKANAVDVFITDLPFGKKSGSMVKNWQLYPEVLLEMARVCQEKTGRAVILTKDKKAISKALTQTAQFWRKRFTYWINIGGLQAGVYVLQRTASALSKSSK